MKKLTGNFPFKSKVKSEPDEIVLVNKPPIAKTVSGFAAKMSEGQSKQLTHVVLKALAGAGKTFSLIVGVAYAFGAKIWPNIQRTMAERINAKHALAWEKDNNPNKAKYVPKIKDVNKFRVEPSDEQARLWDEFVLSAKGGAKNVTYSAFNKSIVSEFGEEWGWLVNILKTLGVNLTFATTNALGHKSVTSAFGRVNCTTWHTQNIISKILSADLRDVKHEKGGVSLISATDELVGLCKLTLTGWDGNNIADPTDKELAFLIDNYGIELEGCRYLGYDGATLEEQVFLLTRDVLKRSLNVAEMREIDFNDQNWLPIVLALPIAKADLLLGDECVPGWTPVMLANGNSKPIKEIVESDEEFFVRAYDIETGTSENCRVTKKHKIQNLKPLVRIMATDSLGHESSIVCTTDHKVYTDRGWVQSGYLTLEDVVHVTCRGYHRRPAAVRRIEIAHIPDDHVYDIEVENCHNFYANGILVHNCQDFSKAKQEYLVRAGHRIVVVGDQNQAAYGFCGASTNSIPEMQKLLKVEQPLFLTETRRCGKAIVAEAQSIVPQFRAHDSNCEGKISHAYYSNKDKDGYVIEGRVTYHSSVDDKDMVLCRLNGPLVNQALKFVTMGRKVVLRGRDFGKQLMEFIKKLKADSIEDLKEKAAEWGDVEAAKENKKKNPSDTKLTTISDKMDVIISFCKDSETVEDVLTRIDLVFAGKQCPRCKKHFDENADRCPEKLCKVEMEDGWPVGPKLFRPEGILFSSIHRAKGLEARRVFFLMPEGAECPLPWVKKDWEIEQERCLRYIGVTRAIEELVFVR